MDDFFRQRNVKYNLEILEGFIKMRFDAFQGAGKHDSALAVATRIIGALDSARVWVRRDIQMSMVPHEFPHREGLDMYASMVPAKVDRHRNGAEPNDDLTMLCLKVS